MRRLVLIVSLASACAHATPSAPIASLRSGCPKAQIWDGKSCVATTTATTELAAATAALAKLDVEEAQQALDGVEKAAPLDHRTNTTLWEQRGIAAAYADDEATATRAFDMLLALDPGHFLSYELSPKATLVFEKTLKEAKQHPQPAVDVSWSRGQRVGTPIPIDIDVLADPKQFLARATLYVRTRGEQTWRATDVSLATTRRITLPQLDARKNMSLELYLTAQDARGNEVLVWADPARPRELPLRYEPPTAWYRTWWGITSIVAGSAALVGGVVYAVTLAPPDKIDGNTTVK